MVQPATARQVKHHVPGTWYFEWTRKEGFGKTLGYVCAIYIMHALTQLMQYIYSSKLKKTFGNDFTVDWADGKREDIHRLNVRPSWAEGTQSLVESGPNKGKVFTLARYVVGGAVGTYAQADPKQNQFTKSN